MFKPFLTFATFLILASPISGQQGQRLLFDEALTMPTGVATVQAVRHILGEIQDRFIPSSFSRENGFGRKLGAIVYRDIKLAFVDIPTDILEEVVLHEVWGHGARAREFGLSVSYRIGPPPPFGAGEGATIFDPPLEVGQNISAHERLALVIGGIEASTMSWSRLAYRWAERGTFNYREALRFGHTMLSAYANTLIESKSDGGKYWLGLNETYFPAGPRIDPNTLEGRALVNLANPLFAASIFRVLWSYQVLGREDYNAPMLSVGGVRWMGWPRYVLTPFGPEWGMEHLVVKGDRVWRMSARVDDGLTDQSSAAVGVALNRIAGGSSYHVGGRAEGWDQPGLEFLAVGLERRSGGLGGLVAVEVIWEPAFARRTRYPWSFVAEVGYKTAGFVPGEQLDGGFILRVGGGF